jgi:tRNA (guanine-N7-)-methyltransferase
MEPSDLLTTNVVSPPKQVRVIYSNRVQRLPEGLFSLLPLLQAEESGFGLGRSLLERKKSAPDAKMIGIEIKAKLVHHAEKQCQRLGLREVRVFWGDVREALARCTDVAVLSRAYIHFPDPWWKKKHQQTRMVVSDALVSSLARLVMPQGEILFQTDIEDRCHQAFRIFQEASLQAPLFSVEMLTHNPYGSISNREVRCAQEGTPIYRFRAIRTAAQGTAPPISPPAPHRWHV